jgi:serine/threonine-protein kinase
MGSSPTGRFEGRLEELFSAAMDLPSAARKFFLEEECEGEPELLSELEELLAAHDESEGFFESLSKDIAKAAEMELDDAAQPRVQIGSYRTLQVIGQGGMGAVYEAERADGAFDQRVALKLLHLNMQTPQLRSRFLAERQLLAHLTHPNIARLVDGGVTDEGRPYFAMEFVDGVPITDYCRNQNLSVAEMLRLFLELVEAVSYLHRNLIVHRDLKPSNIFVDTEGRVKLLDFGVAKLLADEESMGRTMTGEQLLTPQYAAPEQILSGAITTATDVYALGVLLYELLVGRRPQERTLATFATSLDEPITAPSLALKEPVKTPIERSRWRRVAGDLDTICLKALRPEPERRYASADQMGLDIERHLGGLPVRARRSTIGYRLAKFARRNRTAVAGGMLLVALLVYGFARERGLRDRAQTEAAKAEAVSEFLGTLISSADPAQARGQEVTVAQVLERSEELLGQEGGMARQPVVEAAIRIVLGRTYQGLGKVAEAEVQLLRALELAGGLESGSVAALDAAEALGANRTGDYESRERFLRRVVEVRQRTLGAEDDDTLSAAALLVRLLRARGEFGEAEALARENLEKQIRRHGRNHPETLVASNALAGVLYDTARYEEAAGIYRDARAISRIQLGATHPETLRLTSNLGASLSAMGRYREAEPLQREVVEARLRVLGDRHHQTGMSMHNLGSLVMALGRYSEAESWYRRATEARRDLHGAGYLFSKSHLADVIRDQGRLGEAEALYLETLVQQRELLPAEHPDTRRTVSGLATLRLLQGDTDAAEDLALEVLGDQLEIEGEKQLNASDTLHLLARISMAKGEFEEAEAFAERALAIRQEILDSGHPEILGSRLEVAKVQVAKGDIEGAQETMAGLHDALVAVLGSDHPRTREALELGEQAGLAAASS